MVYYIYVLAVSFAVLFVHFGLGILVLVNFAICYMYVGGIHPARIDWIRDLRILFRIYAAVVSAVWHDKLFK